MRFSRLRVMPTRGSLPAARAWVVARAREQGLSPSTTQVVELLASELVANALIHAGGREIVVGAGTGADGFEVAVEDTCDRMPVMRRTGPEVPGGHGMRLVDRLSESWGVKRAPGGGKSVWFRVPLCEEALAS
jgi:anti-sigma regulatory factor (Ser/Thr protein kinase)